MVCFSVFQFKGRLRKLWIGLLLLCSRDQAAVESIDVQKCVCVCVCVCVLVCVLVCVCVCVCVCVLVCVCVCVLVCVRVCIEVGTGVAKE